MAWHAVFWGLVIVCILGPALQALTVKTEGEGQDAAGLEAVAAAMIQVSGAFLATFGTMAIAVRIVDALWWHRALLVCSTASVSAAATMIVSRWLFSARSIPAFICFFAWSVALVAANLWSLAFAASQKSHSVPVSLGWPTLAALILLNLPLAVLLALIVVGIVNAFSS